jgi:hypothetical protein
MSHRSRCAMAAALIFIIPAILTAGASRAAAQADPLADFGDPVETVNAPYRSVPDERRAELRLLPAAAAMDAAPDAAASLHEATLLTAEMPAWSEADGWAGADPQRAALDAFMTVTEPDARFEFALLYGAENIGPEIRETEFYPLLTEGRLLANAELRHLDALDSLLALVAVESERLASAGDTDAAIDRFVRGVRLARMITERAFFREKAWGIERMMSLMQAMRDILYRYPDGATAEHLLDIVARTSDENLLIGRILLPDADRLAALQLVRETFERFGQPDPARFGPAMALVADVEQPLARFGEASWWQRVGESHAGYFDTIDAINASFSDWSLRWSLGPWDPILDDPTDYEQLDPARHAAVLAVVPDYADLFLLRRQIRVEQQGTRTAFAVMSYKLNTGVYPSPLFAIRPRYIQALPLDPFDPREVDPFQYFVPIRDQPRGEREAPQPHQVRVITNAEMNVGVLSQLPGRMVNAISDAALQSNRDFFGAFCAALAGDGIEGEPVQRFLELIERSLMAANRVDEQLGVAAVMGEALQAVTGSRRIRALADASQRRRVLDPAQSREMLRIIFEAAVEIAAERRLTAIETDDPGAIFSVMLDDSVFVLYSIGFDERPGFAETVGVGGEDILIWPPIVALQRNHLVELGRLGE